jgi:hypothetical protein
MYRCTERRKELSQRCDAGWHVEEVAPFNRRLMRRFSDLFRSFSESKRAPLFVGVATGAVAFVVANTVLRRNATFTANGYGYAVRMLMTAGYGYDPSIKAAAEFYHTQPVATNAAFAQILHGMQAPPNWDAVATQIMYPRAAAALFRFRGFESLTDISRLSYVGTAVALYSLLTNFSRPWISSALSLGVDWHPSPYRCHH